MEIVYVQIFEFVFLEGDLGFLLRKTVFSDVCLRVRVPIRSDFDGICYVVIDNLQALFNFFKFLFLRVVIPY